MSSFSAAQSPKRITHKYIHTNTMYVLTSKPPGLPSLSLLLSLIQHPFRHFCNSSLCISLLLLLSSSAFSSLLLISPFSLSLSPPEAYPREPDWSSGCLFGVLLIGQMGTLGHKEERQTEAFEVKGRKERLIVSLQYVHTLGARRCWMPQVEVVCVYTITWWLFNWSLGDTSAAKTLDP